MSLSVVKSHIRWTGRTSVAGLPSVGRSPENRSSERDVPTQDPETNGPSCRFCGAPLDATFVDLGLSPLCESFVARERAQRPRDLLPAARLRVRRVLPRAARGVRERPKRSSASTRTSRRTPTPGWRTRAATSSRSRTAGASTGESLVVELASNDGYLLQYFVERGIPVLGIEPAANVAKVAEERGVETLVEFFGPRARGAARRRRHARRPRDRQQRAGAGARPQRLRGRDRQDPLARPAS